MANTNVEGMTRKILPVVYVIDTSGSMIDDGKIGAVNDAMREAVDLLRDVSDNNANAEVRVAVLKFSTAADWEKPDLVPLDDFFWNDLSAGGTTQVARALEAIDEKFSTKQLFNSDVGYKTPVVIFMSDGEPTDPGEWEKKLDWVMNNNKWFRISIKVAIAIGDDADRACLTKLVGNSESVVTVRDIDTLKSLIKAVTINTIMAGETRNVKPGSNAGKDLMEKAVEEVKGTAGGADPFWDNWNQSSSGTSTTNPPTGDGWNGDNGGWN